MKVLEKLGFWIIPLVALIIIALVYWGPEGFYQNMKELGDTVSGYVPNVSIGMNELNASAVALPAGQAGEISALKSMITKMLDSPDNNCFGDFGGFKSDLGNGDKTTTITFYYDNTPQMTKMKVVNGIGNVYAIYNFSGMRPCIIAGRDNEAENFYRHYVKGEPNLFTPYYRVAVEGIAQGLKISYQNEWSSYNGNTLEVLGWPDDFSVNDEGNNFDNGGLLFKGNNKDICFFPTNKEIDYDDDGIEADIVKELKQKVKNGNLPTCS